MNFRIEQVLYGAHALVILSAIMGGDKSAVEVIAMLIYLAQALYVRRE